MTLKQLDDKTMSGARRQCHSMEYTSRNDGDLIRAHKEVSQLCLDIESAPCLRDDQHITI